MKQVRCLALFFVLLTLFLPEVSTAESYLIDFDQPALGELPYIVYDGCGGVYHSREYYLQAQYNVDCQGFYRVAPGTEGLMEGYSSVFAATMDYITLSMKRNDGGAFSLTGIDLASFMDANAMWIGGYTGGQLAYEVTLPEYANFSTYGNSLIPTWEVDEIQFRSNGLIDNIRVASNAPVAPEPVSSALFLSGGAVLALRKKFRRK